VAPAPSPEDPDERTARLDALRALARAEPDDATTHFLLGRELFAARAFDEAAGAFAAAVRAEPNYTAAYRQWGGALEAAGRRDEAAAAWRTGIDVADRTQDLQTGKEMTALLKRLARDHGIPGPD
jgi:tetratricopeptide (TPR) repeat protein